jgi:hypothetical protein
VNLIKALAITLHDFTQGSIWKIREKEWKEKLGDEYDQKSKRIWHPGLSIKKKQPRDFYELVPVLHGSSGKRDGVVAKGLTSQRGENHTTVFRDIGPSSFQVGAVFKGDKIMPGEKPEGDWYQHNTVAKNHWKPRLDEDEQRSLLDFLKRRGLD